MQRIPCDQALSAMTGPRGATEMQITKCVLSAFAWMGQCMMYDESLGSVQYCDSEIREPVHLINVLREGRGSFDSCHIGHKQACQWSCTREGTEDEPRKTRGVRPNYRHGDTTLMIPTWKKVIHTDEENLIQVALVAEFGTETVPKSSAT